MSAISKAQFFQERLSLASPHDIEKAGDKCIICWDPYDTDEHPGSRLPCGHVFGQQCLVALSNAKGGNQCPLCRSFLFQPDLKIRKGLEDLELPPRHNGVIDTWDDLPRFIQISLIIWFWVVDFLLYVRHYFVTIYTLWVEIPFWIRTAPLYTFCACHCIRMCIWLLRKWL